MMKKILLSVVAAVLIIVGLVLIGRTKQKSTTLPPSAAATTAATTKATTVVITTKPTTKATTKKPKEKKITIPQEGFTEAVPDAYFADCSKPGKVTRIEYASADYADSGEAITRVAYVYTPYGYDADNTKKRYNIIYLMHGWGGETGEYFEYGGVKNMYDNMIAKGDIPPMIIVSPSFYDDESNVEDFNSSVNEFRSFHKVFENDLMPTVESKFHTYAKSASEKDLKAARNHRAFGGFSLGSVTTWLEFCYDYDYIRYFLPMSGSCWYYGGYGDWQTANNVDHIEQLVKENNLNKRGYFIYHAVGTEDYVKEQSLLQAEEMLSRKDFFTNQHYVFYQKQGGEHDSAAVKEYLYNALPIFFGEKGKTDA